MWLFRWKCNPLSWLWGIIPLALIAVLVIAGEQGRIEKDLTRRVEAALLAKGMDWAKPRFRGRDVWIEGKAFDPDEKRRAMKIVRNVWGVRHVGDKASLLQAVSPYIWSAEKKHGELELTGYLPTHDVKKTVLDIVRSRFPDLNVVDRIVIAPGTDDENLFVDGIDFGLRQLENLAIGSVSLSDNDFTISGVARDATTYAAVKSNLEDRMPEGLRLKEDRLRPPLQRRYVLTANKSDYELDVTGFVPSEADRKRFKKLFLSSKFEDLDIQNKLSVASGAPRGWNEAVRTALLQLVQLETGELKIVNKKINLTGVARSDRVIKSVKSVLKSSLPRAFLARAILSSKQKKKVQNNRPAQNDLDNGVTGRDLNQNRFAGNDNIDNPNDSFPNDKSDGGWLAGNQGRDSLEDRESVVKVPEIKTISHYTWSLQKRGRVIRLRGYVASERIKNKMLDTARDTFSGYRIVDELEIARGGPSADRQLRYGDFAFSRLASLQNGRVAIDGNAISITGTPSDEWSYRDTRRQMRNLPAGLALGEYDVSPPVIRNYIWTARKDKKNKRIVLEGYIVSGKARKDLIADVKRRFPKWKVVDKMRLGTGAPGSNWKRAQQFALNQLQKLEQGNVRLDRNRFSISGTPVDSDAYAALKTAANDLPPGFNMQKSRISAPRVDPYVWRADYQDGRITLSGYIESEKDRRNLIEYVERRFPDIVVLDKMETVPGGRRGWLNIAKQSLSQLTRLKHGSVAFWNNEIEIRGAASDEATKDSVFRNIKRAASRSFEIAANLRKEEKTDDFEDDFTEPVESNKVRIDENLRDEELDADTRLNVAQCETYLNTLVSRISLRFQTASSKLARSSFPVLDRLAKIANRCPDARIEVAGHTDSDGNEKFNERLSLRRARAVTSYLVRKGVPRERLEAVGYGETRPIAPNDTPKNKAKNRRIEFFVR